MTHDTIAVLALDAADVELVERFDCDNLRLGRFGGIEPVAEGHDVPVTWEVWPAVATGVPPAENDTVEMRWDLAPLRLAQHFTRHLPMRWRRLLGSPFRDDHANSFSTVDSDHAFDAALGWPGVTEARDLAESWGLMSRAGDGELTAGQLYDLASEQLGRQLGWLAAASERDGGVVGAHTHFLDIVGHTHPENERELRRYYERADEWVGLLAEASDELVVLSDHGMQTSVVPGDDDPGHHSWRAMFSTTIDGGTPSSVLDVKAYLEDESEPYNPRGGGVNRDTINRLKDLGYT